MLARIRKALVAALGAGASAYLAGSADGTVSQADWAMVVGSLIVVGVVTWAVPNKTAPDAPAGVTGTYGGQFGGKP
jgi:hypothetical protein